MRTTDILFTVFTGNKGCFDISIKTFRHSFSAIAVKKERTPSYDTKESCSFIQSNLFNDYSIFGWERRTQCMSFWIKTETKQSHLCVKRQKCSGILWGNLSRAAAVGHLFESFKSDDEIRFGQLTQFVFSFVCWFTLCVRPKFCVVTEWMEAKSIRFSIGMSWIFCCWMKLTKGWSIEKRKNEVKFDPNYELIWFERVNNKSVYLSTVEERKCVGIMSSNCEAIVSFD